VVSIFTLKEAFKIPTAKEAPTFTIPPCAYLTLMQKELMWEWKAMEKAIQFAITVKQHFHSIHPMCINWALHIQIYK